MIFLRPMHVSPLTPKEKKEFNGLKYYPFDPQYIFYGEIERYIFQINSPQVYATFLTNNVANQRYILYGKLHFMLNMKP